MYKHQSTYLLSQHSSFCFGGCVASTQRCNNIGEYFVKICACVHCDPASFRNAPKKRIISPSCRTDQQPRQKYRYSDGGHASRTHHNRVRHLIVQTACLLQIVDAMLIGIFVEFLHLHVAAELHLGRVALPEQLARRRTTLDAPDRTFGDCIGGW